MFDTIIRNGTVIDGTGKARFKADVGIEGDRLTLVGPANDAKAKQEIDATGKIVCPGFVDPHSHADMSVWSKDHATFLEPLIRQGITTFVGGNCGMALAPIVPENADAVAMYVTAFSPVNFETDVKWNTVGDYFDVVESNGIAMNMAMLAPHGLIRLNAMRGDQRPPTPDELKTMVRLVEQSVEEGACGLSTGLQYFPGSQAMETELLALARALKPRDAMFTSHLRSYSNTVPQAMDEIVSIARTADIRAQLSHLFWGPDMGFIAPLAHAFIRAMARLSKVYMPPIPIDGLMARELAKLEKSRKSGIAVHADVMPSTISFTHVLAFFPPWVIADNLETVLGRLRDPAERARIRHDIERGRQIWPHDKDHTWSLNLFKILGWSAAYIMAVGSERNKRCEGMQLIKVAEERGVHPFDAICDLLLEENGKVLVFMALADPDDYFTERSFFSAMRDPNVSICTDTILMGIGKPAQLFYSCYPRVLGRYVRDLRLLSLETAIHKSTALSADHFQLKKRGRIEEGCFADVVMFDPVTIASQTSFAEPNKFPTGIEHVFINGRHVLNGAHYDANAMAGRVLRHGA
jgi:N-acyl-D-aspartate/D-glutamate deacylase